MRGSHSLGLITVVAVYFCLNISGDVQAQPSSKSPRLGYLSPFTSANINTENAVAFRERLRSLGWIPGSNLTIEYRWADGKYERLHDLAAELVRLNVNAIFANSGVAAIAAKKATASIPIIFEMIGDPVASGLIVSLGQPGGNITGVAGLGRELSTKQLELLKEIVPKLRRIGLLANPENTISAATTRETRQAATAHGVQVQVLNIRAPGDLDAAFENLGKTSVGAMMVAADPLLTSHRKRILDFAARKRLPAMYYVSLWVPDGGLMSYSASQPEQFRKAATLVNKVFNGTKPADLPVEQPTKFELVINLKAAKQIGVTIPPHVLARADRVIR